MGRAGSRRAGGPGGHFLRAVPGRLAFPGAADRKDSLKRASNAPRGSCGRHLALRRHATSKLPESGSLAEVRTLGFRGEALPSIAHVARLEIESRAAGSDSAVRALARGESVRMEECAHAPGTTVRVEGIFDDLPPRKKFLRSPRSEVKAAVRLVSAYALARPEAAFSLTVEGKSIFRWARAAS